MLASLTHISVILMMAFTIHSQQTFTASFVNRDVGGSSLLNFGSMRGTLIYDFASAKAVKFNYPSQQFSELFQFNPSGGVGTKEGQFIHKAGPLCGGCESSTNPFEIPILWKDLSYYTDSGRTTEIGGRTCNMFTRVAAKPDMPVTNIWFEGNNLCRFRLANGNRYDISGVSPAVNPAEFATPANCKCGKKMDIVLVLDSSFSIKETDWAQIQSFVQNFVRTFTAGPQESAFGVVQFGYDTQIDLPLTTDQATINFKLVDNILPQFKVRLGTCLTCGIRDGVLLLLANARPGATPVMLVATDGFHNRILTPGCEGGTKVQNAICDIGPYVQFAQAAVPGIQLFAVGVNRVGPEQLLATAGGDPTRIFKYDTFASFAQQFAQISKRTCEAAAVGASCGVCCGFCACGKCQAPDFCDDNNACTLELLNGQQCCSPPAPFCSAPDKCTTTQCDAATGQCVNTAITCAPAPCKNVRCDPVSGCVYEDKCPTLDLCNPRTCVNEQCITTPVVCPADDQCTTYKCDSTIGQCVPTSTAARCIDNRPCTADSCDPRTGCVNTLRCQNDGDKCFENFSCNEPDGACLKAQVNCDDKNACTADTCDSGTGCAHRVITCDATGKDQCSLLDTTVGVGSGCNPAVGCIYKPKNCDDGKPWTFDECDPATGICNNSDIPGYDRYCNSSTCHLSPPTNPCFKFSCDSTLPVFNNCAIVVKTDCDDGNDCTINTCSNTTGCVTTAVACPAAPPCMVAKCDRVRGCYNETLVCNDGNPCTIDECDPSNNKCTYTLKCPISQDLCTNQFCQLGNCASQNLCVASPDPCSVTTRKCNTSSGCETVPLCFDNDPCTIDTCTVRGGRGICAFVPKDCDDGNACTRDYCTAGNCKSDPITCNDNDKCTDDTCDPLTGCNFTKFDPAVKCQDFSVCTRDICTPDIGCQNVNITCDDNNNCTINSCHPNRGCQYVPRPCPNSGCEVGFCEVGVCKVTQTGCISSNTIVAAASVGGGVLAAIIIGIIVALSAAAAVAAQRLGLFDAQGALDSSGMTNPLYEQATQMGESRIYEGLTGDSYIELKS